MDLEYQRIDANASGKRKACEVDFDTLSQDAIEGLIRKDVDDICSIFGVPVRNSCPIVFDNSWVLIVSTVG